MRLLPKSIRWQMVLVMSVVSAITLAAMGLNALRHVEKSAHIAGDYQLTLTRKLAEIFDSRFDQAVAALEDAVDNLPESVLGNRLVADIWLTQHAGGRTAFFDHGLYLTDSGGNLITTLSTTPDLAGSPQFQKWVAKAIELEETLISLPFMTADAVGDERRAGSVIVLLVTPILTDTGSRGALVGAVDVNGASLLGSIKSTTLDGNGYFFVTSWDGSILMHPDQRLLLRKGVHPVPAELLQRATHGSREVVETVDDSGTAVLSTFTKLQSTGWVLGMNTPLAEAYAEVREQERESLYSLVAGILFAALVALAMMRIFISPLRRLAREIKGIDVSRGKRIEAVEVRGGSEIRQLADEFNTLAQRINQDREALALAASVFDNAQEGILITDAEARVVSVNPAFSRISGYAPDELLGRNPSILKSGLHDREFYQAMWQALASHGSWRGEVWNRRRNGEIYAELVNINAVRDAQGRLTRYISISTDITDLKKTQRKLENLATTDPLTGLPNRTLLADRLEQTIAHAGRLNRIFMVAFLDLDGFKAVNDHNGHHFGDLLLIQVAARLRECLRTGDTVARLGGDEFVLILTNLEDRATGLNTLERLLDAVSEPYAIDGREAEVSASIGVTVFPADAADAETLLRYADQAMYRAKNEGRGRIRVFDPALDRTSQTRRQTVERFREALQTNELLLHYQPKIDLRSGRIVGLEALLRWLHTERGLLAPPLFLDDFRKHPIIIEVGDWVLAEAVRQMAAWRDQHGLDLPISVNLTAQHLVQPGFTERLRGLFGRHPNVQPDRLEIEILESDAMQDMAEVRKTIARCRDFGIGFAIDDFGTGQASLSYLRNVPADTIKIDRSFIHSMLAAPEDHAVVEGIVRLAKIFGRKVIAEGVESEQQGRALIALGCHHAQGYGIAPPMPAEAVADWVNSFRPSAWQKAD